MKQRAAGSLYFYDTSKDKCAEPDSNERYIIEKACDDTKEQQKFTFASNIRLSKSPNEGFIEIKNASTWRKVKEEIWDIIRENSLCQHLGFNGTLGNVAKTRRIKKGKICENPLLENKTKFQDAIFSGRGSTDNSKYKEARFFSDGWCPTESGDKYLKIDIQNEYHITRVMVMGDKDQTKWSGSYSLKYSHNESLVDGSRAINGNQNGYQASATDVDIYNVRYIKLESNGGADFCLRMEVCGEVQTPAPVQRIVAEPSFYSVNLSWTIPVAKTSSYITHFIIYLNGTERDTISRAQYGNNFILGGLSHNTYYKLGIKSQDGNSKYSSTVYQSFQTKRPGFFLRHTSSGKCIAAGNTAWNDKYGDRHWAKLFDCLNVTVQLRYLQGSEALHNIARKGVVTLLNGGKYKQRMVIYDSTTPSWEGDAIHSMKQRASGSLYFYHNSRDKCAEPDSNERYIIEKSCDDTKEQQKFTFGSVRQFGNKMKDVHCSPIQRMVIHKAHYGDFNDAGMFNNDAIIDIKCSRQASCEVKPLCGGNRSCELTIDNNILSSQYCPDTKKELYIEYTCVDNYENPIKAAPNIRLSKLPNEGFIEIKNASTWRKVKEEIWDITREKSLCQHFGFNETLGSVSKICENALLQNQTKLPDAIFSGSGSTDNTKYKEARFSSDGWCPTESGDKYLKIDLQNEYHITRVMVMGDKNQTKWGGSYSLKYSHDESLVHGSRAVQINGNQNGYQASATDLNINNARYIKLESNCGADFCLRIEVCGEVSSEPPQNVIFKSRGTTSLGISWTAPVSTRNDELTGYQVCFSTRDTLSLPKCLLHNNTKTLSFTITDLRPSTKYFVTVSAITKSCHGKKSLNVSKITNGEPVIPIAASYYTLTLSIPRPEGYIKEVLIIVQRSTSRNVSSEVITTSDLKNYQLDTQDPYITAYLKADVLPLMFVIGDGKNYSSEKNNYHNQPLTRNSSYNVFLRFFESQDSYYSTEWSGSIYTMGRPSDRSGKQSAHESTEDKTRLDLLIPLSILALCLLLSFGVIIYLCRRLNSYSSSKGVGQAMELDSIQTPTNRLTDDANDCVPVYEIPDEIEQNEAAHEIDEGQESSDYMPLNDNREPTIVYQSLQPPGTNNDQTHPKGGGESMEYENAAFK
ncbi:uncharacterized protein LOC114525365 [Dendronephthya gigantea]|uniref:uncharacterized protein LOC114525365 n=1 Tax=Dendronephthya gigantea TaxID=151771 RepID=UPI00106C0F09|nr:uncharacterized protein LOC114525365 [Dendronephthya gigantea]